MERDSMHDRGRGLEEEYFRKKNRELIDKMRREAAEAQARQELEDKTGLHDPEAIAELQALGFTPETVSLLPLMPVIRVAWAEGGVTEAESFAITKLARSRGVAEGSAADRQLAEWLRHCPEESVFARAMRLIAAILDSPAQQAGLTADDLVKYCEEIAAASGGIFGIRRVSADERELLNSIAVQLKGKKG